VNIAAPRAEPGEGFGNSLAHADLDWVLRPNGVECEDVKWMWCPNCEDIKKVPLSCDDPRCPRCHYSWAAKESHHIVHRLFHARGQGVRGRIWELIISPPRSAIGMDQVDVDDLMKQSYAIAREHNMVGGCAVAHYAMDESPLEWRPHVHLLGMVPGRYRPGPARNGWTIKFIRVGGRREDVREKARYELSHCIRARSRHAVRWWGRCSYSNISNPTEDEIRAMGFDVPDRGTGCPDCGHELEPMVIMDYTGWPPVTVGIEQPWEPPDGDETHGRRY